MKKGRSSSHGGAGRDPWVERLAALFAGHPAWVQAARKVVDGASSDVTFRHLPGERWHLMRRDGISHLEPGPSPDPDFAFVFTPRAVDRLAAVEGGADDFAIALFELILSSDPDEQVGFRIVASFPRLVRRGYLGLVLAGGPKLVAFGARHGVRGLNDLRRLVADSRRGTPP